jgi:hypothetical protein
MDVAQWPEGCLPRYRPLLPCPGASASAMTSTSHLEVVGNERDGEKATDVSEHRHGAAKDETGTSFMAGWLAG